MQKMFKTNAKKVVVAVLTMGVLATGGATLVNASNTRRCERTSSAGLAQSGPVCHMPNLSNSNLIAGHVSWRHGFGQTVRTDIQHVPTTHDARAVARNGSSNTAVGVWTRGAAGLTIRASTPNNRNANFAATTYANLRLR